MKKARNVRQQWLFDCGLVGRAPLDEWCGESIDQMATLGNCRNLFDGDGRLVRKVSLSDLERMTIGEDGRSVLERVLSQADVASVVLVDDRPHCENPTIRMYADAVARGALLPALNVRERHRCVWLHIPSRIAAGLAYLRKYGRINKSTLGKMANMLVLSS